MKMENTISKKNKLYENCTGEEYKLFLESIIKPLLRTTLDEVGNCFLVEINSYKELCSSVSPIYDVSFIPGMVHIHKLVSEDEDFREGFIDMMATVYGEDIG